MKKLKNAHWCAECDNRTVNSENPASGQFFLTFGHNWSATGEYKGEYKGAIFALCTDCDNLSDILAGE